MQSYKMEVSKKQEVNGTMSYVRQGEIEVPYPLLSDLGLSIEPTKNDEEGFPIYGDEKVQYVFDAVLAAVKAQARNKLVSGTATLKPGLSIASSVEELLESGGNKGDALAAVREFLAAFKAWLPKTGKSEKVQQAVYELARVKSSVSLQPDDKKAKFAAYLSDFAESLDDTQAARFERPLLALNEACEAGDALDDM